eukprot:gene1902-4996_t
MTEAFFPFEPELARLVITSYDGDQNEELYHGRGRAEFRNGDVYEGDFDNGLLHGKGKFIWTDGLVYQGNFIDNIINGKGKYTWPDGSEYSGTLVKGLRDGLGTLKLPTGVVYSGEWRQSLRHGKGKLDHPNHLSYEGDWFEDLPTGFGRMTYPSGNYYVGEWKNGTKEGQGKMVWTSINQCFHRAKSLSLIRRKLHFLEYEGSWLQGQPHGRGCYTWIQQRIEGSQYVCRNSYVGEFQHGRRHGNGTFFFAEGSVLEGNWANNIKHGKHIMTFPNGIQRELEFVNDRLITPIDKNCYATYVPKFEDLHGEENDFGNQQITNAILQNMSLLRRTYNFYSKLAMKVATDNVYSLRRFQ